MHLFSSVLLRPLKTHVSWWLTVHFNLGVMRSGAKKMSAALGRLVQVHKSTIRVVKLSFRRCQALHVHVELSGLLERLAHCDQSIALRRFLLALTEGLNTPARLILLGIILPEVGSADHSPRHLGSVVQVEQ